MIRALFVKGVFVFGLLQGALLVCRLQQQLRSRGGIDDGHVQHAATHDGRGP